MLSLMRVAQFAPPVPCGRGGLECLDEVGRWLDLSLFGVEFQCDSERLTAHYPALEMSLGSKDPSGWDIVVNATPLGMKPGDPLPIEVDKLSSDTFVGEVVMKEEITPLLRAAMAKGCAVQVGTDMLFEMIPAYLEFFGFGHSTPEELRDLARLTF